MSTLDLEHDTCQQLKWGQRQFDSFVTSLGYMREVLDGIHRYVNTLSEASWAENEY